MLFIVLSLGLSICVSWSIGAISATALVYAPCNNNGMSLDDTYEWESFTLSARDGGRFRGYFIHGTNGATVIFPPNFTAGRNSRLFEALPFVDAGYNVVVYESRRCANMGPLSLGYEEVSEVADVLDYLALRGDVDMAHIGVHGFSSAGATAIMAAAQYPQIKAVVAVGNYADMNAILDADVEGVRHFFYMLYQHGFRFTYQLWVGNSLDTLKPIEVIDQIYPRPILLIYGSEEPGALTSEALMMRADENATLWILEGEGHGSYRRRTDYSQRTIAFFDQHLLDTLR
ncbi:MAG: hypothetical protein CUN55_01215 [Phototrophicales bacterium]|nr:MAG: hypothetical protein CUN55_01215 [Phototrophicales bacterium]